MKPEHRVVCETCGYSVHLDDFDWDVCREHHMSVFGVVDATHCSTIGGCLDGEARFDARDVSVRYIRVSSGAWTFIKNAMEKINEETVDEVGREQMWGHLVMLDSPLMVWEEVQEP